jgi:gluconate 2-dehydrogenase alpha chain
MTDVAVVGLGPAGTVLAHLLDSAGLAVVALQPLPVAGGRAPLASPAPTVRRTPGEQARPAPGAPMGADRLGGSKHLAAPQSYRLDEGAFRLHSRALSAGHRLSLPHDVDLADWPVDADDLAPYYERIERLMRVGPRAATPWTDRMRRAATLLGHDPFAAPAAASRDVSPLLHGSAVRVIDATATEITTGSTGAVTGLRYIGAAGGAGEIVCPVVVVAASVVPTIRLLLASGIDGGGLVGSSFMAHNSFTVHGWFPGVDLGRDRGEAAQAVAVSGFEGARLDPADVGFLGGSVLQAAMGGPRTAAWRSAVAVGRPRTADAAGWVADHEAQIGTVWAQPDQLPRTGNRVDLDPHHVDASGRPVARITFDLADDDRSRWSFLGARMTEWLRAAGATSTWAAPLEAQPLGTHLYGGVRMGTHPGSSVVDSFGRAHDTPGLVALGSSTFPSTGGRGPVQTVEALAWRSAERIVADLA